MSVIVMGLDDWPISHSTEIAEERLLSSAQSILGKQVSRFLTPPRGPESVGAQTNWFDESRQIGVPVAPFPRWMVCSRCRLLAPLKSGLFEPKVFPYRPDRACYVHNCTTQGRPPLVVPARFLATCERGHLDDFPWLEFVHRGATDCHGPFRRENVPLAIVRLEEWGKGIAGKGIRRYGTRIRLHINSGIMPSILLLHIPLPAIPLPISPRPASDRRKRVPDG